MIIPPEVLLERKRLKKNLSVWQLLAILAIGLCIYLASKNNNPISKTVSEDFIASITIDDSIILEDKDRDEALERLKDNSHIKAIILNLNSPGGSAVASEKIYKILRDVAETKPLVAVMSSMAASGAYMISLASDYIIAYHTTLTGSIGVLIRSFEATELGEKIGVKFINLKSNKNKAALFPTEKLGEEEEQVIRESIEDTYNFFLNLVKERRKLNDEQISIVGDGRVFTGNQALKLNLIDKIGTKKDASDWLVKQHKIPASLKVREVSLRKEGSFIDKVIENFKLSFQSNLINPPKGLLMIFDK